MRLKLLSILTLLCFPFIAAEFDDRFDDRYKPVNQSNDQPHTRSINQSINQTTNQSISESQLGIWWAPVVNTTGGLYQGYTYNGLNYYLGIPYAEPPINELRFTPPVKKLSVDQSVHRAYWYGKICPQVIIGSVWLGDEDCLYLNVYAPYQSNEQAMVQKPVFVWIYGGSFVFGDGWEFGLYEASNFVKANDVIVVTFNYRLGPLGFMNGPGISGNAGLMDQRMVLDWIHDNIEQFGGDPNQVIIGGESAGAMSVCSQLAHQLHLMKQTNNQLDNQLFHGVIMQSGTCDSATFWPSLDSSVDWSIYYAELLGCPYNQSINHSNDLSNEQSFLNCLRSLPVDVFVQRSKSKDQSADQPNNQSIDYDNVEFLKKHFDSSILRRINESSIHSDDNVLNDIAQRHIARNDQSALESMKKSLKHSLKQSNGKLSSQMFEVNPPPLPILYPAVPWTPVIDGEFLTDSPLNIIQSTYQSKQTQSNQQSIEPLPVLIGTNLDEGTLFIRQLYAILPQLHDPLIESDLHLIYQHVFGESGDQSKNQSSDIIAQIEQHYPPTDYPSINELIEVLLRDYIFACPSRRLLKTIHRSTNQSNSQSDSQSTWLYQYRYNPGWIDNAYLGVYHSAELEFVFGNQWPPLVHMFDATDRLVVQLIHEKWGNFVKYGDVNANSSNRTIDWPAWSPSQKFNLLIDHPASIQHNLLGGVCDFWDSVDQAINQSIQQQKRKKLQAIRQPLSQQALDQSILAAE